MTPGNSVGTARTGRRLSLTSTAANKDLLRGLRSRPRHTSPRPPAGAHPGVGQRLLTGSQLEVFG